MATPYSSLISEVAPFVLGCPDTLIVSHIRRSVIDLCVRASVYRRDLEAISTQAGFHEYDLEAPAATVVHRVDGVTHLGKPLGAIDSQLLEDRYSGWRLETARGTPEVYMQRPGQLIWLVPTPDATAISTTIIHAVLKPERTSTSCDDEIIDDYIDTIVHGALAGLLKVPGMAWTDNSLSNQHMGLFLEGVNNAETHAAHNDTNIQRNSRFTDVTGRAVRKKRRRY